MDYDEDIWYNQALYPHKGYNMIIPLIHKRIEFFHESEARIFIQIQEAIFNDDYWDTEIDNKGKSVKVDLHTLIEKIYLPPTIDQKAVNKILDLSNDSGYCFDFVKSKLSDERCY